MLRKFLRLSKLFLWKIDLFSSSQLLRYKSQNSYSTLTGGFLSLVIIIVFGTILIRNSIEVATKANIIAKDSIYYVENPTFYNLTFDESSKFMFGVGIMGMNLSDPYRLFDITLNKGLFSYGRYVSMHREPLQQCEQQQWAHINQIAANSFKHANLSAFLCPHSNLTVEMQGKFSLQQLKYFSISIGECHNETDPLRPCVDPTTIPLNRSFNVQLYYMNPYVNSGNQDPVQYYFQDREYLIFNPTASTVGYIYMTEQTISTDTSLMPWSQIKNQTLLTIKELSQVRQDKFLNADQYYNYATYYFKKSGQFVLSQRSFTKIDQLFSNIGGLFGFAVALFFFLNYYTEASFEIEMGDVLFHYKEDEPLKAGGYNIFFHAILSILEILKKSGFFKSELPWKRMEVYSQCREEVVEQLDVSLLMNKVTFLEKCMNVIFEQHQFRAIYLQQKPDVEQARKLRINHGLNKIIHKNSKLMDNKIKGKIKQRQSILYRQSLSLSGPKNDQQNLAYMRRQTCPDAIMQDFLPQEKPSSEQTQKHKVIDVVFNYIMSDQMKSKKEPVLQQANYSEKESKSSNFGQAIELENAAGQHGQSLKFVQKALNDMRLIEAQAREGNKISQRIYSQINNDITKDQIIILKCIESIVTQNDQMKLARDSETNTKNFLRKQSQQGISSPTGKLPTQVETRYNRMAMITQQKMVKDQEQLGSDNHRIIQSSEF